MCDRKAWYAYMGMTVSEVTEKGMCIGCGACVGCEHITFETGKLGFPVPVVDEGCVNCGKCLKNCPVNMDENDED